MPVAAKTYTWDEIKDWPESAARTELVEGELVVSPTPGRSHNYAASRLALILGAWVFDHQLGEFFAQPFSVVLAPDLTFEPDLCFVSKEREELIGEQAITGPPDLVVEIVSESNRTHDTVVKFEKYALYGVREYWLVDLRERTVSTWREADGAYQLIGRATGQEHVTTDVLSGVEVLAEKLFL